HRIDLFPDLVGCLACARQVEQTIQRNGQPQCHYHKNRVHKCTTRLEKLYQFHIFTFISTCTTVMFKLCCGAAWPESKGLVAHLIIALVPVLYTVKLFIHLIKNTFTLGAIFSHRNIALV